MSELTDRGKAFHAAIAGFVGKKLEKKPKDENGNFAAATAPECEAWLAGAIKNVPKLYAATHVLKATHPKAAGSDVYADLRSMDGRNEIGTHNLGNTFDEDIIASTAAYLGASSFLRAEAEGRRFLDWIKDDDADFRAALNSDPDVAGAWMTTLRGLGRKEGKPETHPMAKQVYWLIGDEPHDDTRYHLLQPMFSSSLTHAVHADIQEARFGEVNKQARQAFRDKKPSETPYRDYRNMVVRKLGGTKPQNISQLNSERGGLNYLLASLPPPAWQRNERTNVTKHDSAFDVFLWFENVRELVDTLRTFLRGNPNQTMESGRCQHR